MSWKDHLNQITKTVREAAESDTARNATSRARETAQRLAERARNGALDAAKSLVDSYADPSALNVQFHNARLSIVSPSNGLEIGYPNSGVLVISDGENNGLIINAAAKPAYVADTIGTVTRLDSATWDLGPEDGLNVVILGD